MHQGKLQAAGIKPVGLECPEFNGREHLTFLCLVKTKKIHLEYVFQAKARNAEVALTWLSSSSQRSYIKTNRSSEEDCVAKTDTSWVLARGGLKWDLPNPMLQQQAFI